MRVNNQKSKYRKYLLSTLALFLVLASIIYWLKNTQYVPSELVVQSVDFINKLNAKQLELAYEKTTKKGELFNGLEAFKQKYHKEFFRHIHLPETATNRKIFIEHRSTSPFQTYGNRLRRRVTGKRVGTNKISLDFLLNFRAGKGVQRFLPFDVRWKLEQNGEWKIYYFQSHAA